MHVLGLVLHGQAAIASKDGHRLGVQAVGPLGREEEGQDLGREDVRAKDNEGLVVRESRMVGSAKSVWSLMGNISLLETESPLLGILVMLVTCRALKVVKVEATEFMARRGMRHRSTALVWSCTAQSPTAGRTLHVQCHLVPHWYCGIGYCTALY